MVETEASLQYIEHMGWEEPGRVAPTLLAVWLGRDASERQQR